MRRRTSFRARVIAAGVLPILLMGAAAAFTAVAAASNARAVSALFETDLFMRETMAGVDQIVASLAAYIDTKNSDALRAYMREATLLAERAARLDSGSPWQGRHLLERNVAVLIRRLLEESEGAVRAKRGRNIPEYGARFQKVEELASFISERADALSLERLGQNLERFDAMARDLDRAGGFLAAMLASALVFAAASTIRYAIKMTDPLAALAAAAARISRGDYAGGPLPEGGDEIGQTAGAFNLMQASVAAHVADIRAKAAVEASLMDERLKNLSMAGHLRSAELKALQSRINPHFLFNTLNAGIQLATVEDADRTRVFLERLAGLMRYSFRDLDAPVALSDELACLRDFAYLMSIRFPDMFELSVDASEEALKAAVPKLIVQPVVENSMRHGFPEGSGGARVSIRARREGDELVLVIEDNGSGIPAERAREILEAASAGRELGAGEGGVGLTNVIARLRLFAARDDAVGIEDAGPGARVVVRVPFKEAY